MFIRRLLGFVSAAWAWFIKHAIRNWEVPNPYKSVVPDWVAHYYVTGGKGYGLTKMERFSFLMFFLFELAFVVAGLAGGVWLASELDLFWMASIFAPLAAMVCVILVFNLNNWLHGSFFSFLDKREMARDWMRNAINCLLGSDYIYPCLWDEPSLEEAMIKLACLAHLVHVQPREDTIAALMVKYQLNMARTLVAFIFRLQPEDERLTISSLRRQYPLEHLTSRQWPRDRQWDQGILEMVKRQLEMTRQVGQLHTQVKNLEMLGIFAKAYGNLKLDDPPRPQDLETMQEHLNGAATGIVWALVTLYGIIRARDERPTHPAP